MKRDTNKMKRDTNKCVQTQIKCVQTQINKNIISFLNLDGNHRKARKKVVNIHLKN